MRHSRLTTLAPEFPAVSAPPLVAVAHGSADPRAAGSVGDLLRLVRSRAAARGLAAPPGLDVRMAFLGHAPPSPGQVLGAVESGPVVVLPLLLTAAYHSKTDLPALLAEARRANPRLRISYGGTLGPHPLLLRALSRRLGETVGETDGDLDPGRTSVVLAAAGSSDPAANATITRLAARWQAAEGWRAVVPAYASAMSPSPAEAVRALAPGGPVVVATYLLAPGFFADRIRREALDAGAAAVSGALGATTEVADVVLDRYAAAEQTDTVQRAVI
jgi:sirohydrochlorin ferrochelatase